MTDPGPIRAGIAEGKLASDPDMQTEVEGYLRCDWCLAAAPLYAVVVTTPDALTDARASVCKDCMADVRLRDWTPFIFDNKSHERPGD